MIFQVCMKDPDTLYDAATEAVEEELINSSLPTDEQDALKEMRVEKAMEVASKWFEYGEYLTVEIDTDEQTIRVVSPEEE